MPNLVFYAPADWDDSVVANIERGSRSNGSLAVGQRSNISFAIINESESVEEDDQFFVDLYFDDTFVERWRNDLMPSNVNLVVNDWDALESRIRVTDGEHRLKIVLDSTNLVDESNEEDNVIERIFVWEHQDEILLTETPVRSRLPDLSPHIPEEWDSPLIVSSYEDSLTDGPLSIDEPTYIRFSFQNEGLTSTDEDVWAHVFLDDVLVHSVFWNGLLADQFIRSSLWDGLHDVINLTPGAHMLRVEFDPTNLVDEDSEDNNSIEKSLVWASEPVPPRAEAFTPSPTPIPGPPTLPNLVPGWKFEQDGPIIVSHTEEEALNEPLSTSNVPYIDVVVQNLSRVAANGTFSFDLYYDGQRVRRFDFSGRVPPGSFMRAADWAGLPDILEITEGPHTLTLVIDPDDTLEEANESDNVFETTFVWGTGQLKPREFILFSNEDLVNMTANLEMLMNMREPVIDSNGRDISSQILDVADAGYFLMTAKSVHDERANIYLLSHDDYENWIDDRFTEVSAMTSESSQERLVQIHENYKKVSAFKERRFGKIAIVVNAEREPAKVIASLAHELGHMRQDIHNPAQTEATTSHLLSGLQEAQAQQFERAFWLTLEGFTGLNLLSYPEYDAFRGFILSRYHTWSEEINSDEHSLGYLLQWLAVLNDPELSHLREELVERGELTASSSLEMHNYFVGIPAFEARGYVEERLLALETSIETMEEYSSGRLVDGLNSTSEGHSALKIPALLMP